MRNWLLSSLLFCTTLTGEIYETSRFSDILSYVSPETLVLLDIDDTLLLPKQTLGTDVWFIHRLNENVKLGLSLGDALYKALHEWIGIRHLTDVVIVEEGTDKVVREMQDNGIMVMGLTTQDMSLVHITPRQLLSLGIDLSRTSPSDHDCYLVASHKLLNNQGVLLRHGILFTSGTKKGESLLNILNHLSLKPKHVVFINDKLTHLKDVEEDLERNGIKFTGLRYGIGDSRVANFRADIADIQWTHSTFGKILSDDEAEALLKK